MLKELVLFFLIFAKIGAMTFGGGYAMLPFLQREVVERKGWATEEELADYYAIAQCTPGVIAVNVATFVGYKNGGVSAAVAATAGVVSPSVVIILVLASAISAFAEYPAVQHAFAGIRVCIAVLVFNAVVKLWKKAVVDKATLLIFLAVFFGSVMTGIPVMLFVLVAGALGLALSSRRKEGQM